MKARFVLDTSCMVAAVCAWHAAHDATLKEISRRLAAGKELVSAAPALVEAYSVLTRFPPPHRLRAADALALLDANFISDRRVVALSATDYVRLLRGAPEDGIAGGQTYDAVIAHCAVKARARELFTLNENDFLPWHGTAFEVIVPAGPLQ